MALFLSSQASSRAGIELERRAQGVQKSDLQQRQSLQRQALVQYQSMLGDLQKARPMFSASFEPTADIPLAKSYLDVARASAVLGSPADEAEARKNIGQAKAILLESAGRPMSQEWAWRTAYLLGDVALMESDVATAREYYKAANSANPCSVPAAAMYLYLDPDAVLQPRPPDCPGPPAPEPLPAAAQQPQTVPLAPPPQPEPQSQAGTSAALAPPQNTPPRQIQTTTTVKTTTTVQIGAAAATQSIKKGMLDIIPPSLIVNVAAKVLPEIAEAIGIAEASPWAAALSVAGMVMASVEKAQQTH